MAKIVCRHVHINVTPTHQICNLANHTEGWLGIRETERVTVLLQKAYHKPDLRGPV